jgi:hypothetical protein
VKQSRDLAGYLYCYKRPFLPDHIKVGHVQLPQSQYEKDQGDGYLRWAQKYTEAEQAFHAKSLPPSIVRRMRLWHKQCGYVPHVIYWAPIPYGAHRIESLVHRQLAPHRREEPKCERCKKKHREWFKVEQKVARDAVDLWCRFSALQPYEFGGLLRNWCQRTYNYTHTNRNKDQGTVGDFVKKMSIWMDDDETSPEKT